MADAVPLGQLKTTAEGRIQWDEAIQDDKREPLIATVRMCLQYHPRSRSYRSCVAILYRIMCTVALLLFPETTLSLLINKQDEAYSVLDSCKACMTCLCSGTYLCRQSRSYQARLGNNPPKMTRTNKLELYMDKVTIQMSKIQEFAELI